MVFVFLKFNVTKPWKKLSLLFLSLFLISCSYDRIYSNRESHKNEAQKITTKLYWELLYGSNKDKIYDLFSENFFEVSSKEKLDELIMYAQQESGVIKEYNLENWETLVVKGSNARSEYLLIYDVTRESRKTKETFSMRMENGVIKIVGYHINHILSDK